VIDNPSRKMGTGKKHARNEDDEEEMAKQAPKEKRQKTDEPVDYEDEEGMHKRAEAMRSKKRRMAAAAEAGIELPDSEESMDSDYEGEAKPERKYIAEEAEYGVTLEAFNLKDEIRDRVINLNSGVVDTKGGEKAEEDEAWLQEYDSNMKSDDFASKMADLQQKLEAQNAMEPEYLEETTKAQLLDEISDILRWGETVSKALVRLRPKNHPKSSNNKQTAASTSPSGQPPTQFDLLTSKVDQASRVHGVHDIFSLSKEEILDIVEKEQAVAQPQEMPKYNYFD